MKKFIVTVIILILVSCQKESAPDPEQTTPPVVILKCGTILSTPILDSFIYPTYYLTAPVAFNDGTEILHFQDNVTGDHDGS